MSDIIQFYTSTLVTPNAKGWMLIAFSKDITLLKEGAMFKDVGQF